MRPDYRIKSCPINLFPKLPKTAVFTYLKIDMIQMAQKVPTYLSNFCTKICPLQLTIIAKSGHTGKEAFAYRKK